MAPERVDIFVPAHVTGLFSVHRRDDPRATGSRGAGMTLSDGIHVAVEPADASVVHFEGTTIAVEAVDRVLDQFELEAAVSVRSDVPLGAGFGASGAMALGTAIGCNALSDRRRTANELATLAHVADVEAGTGLGDVVAQMRGGIPIRREPGAPGYGRLDGIAETARIEYLPLGELSTKSVLAGDLDRLNAAGASALERLLEAPTLETFVSESRRFARGSELLADEVADVVDEVVAGGGQASMAMLGKTVFAVGTGLSDAGYEPEVCEIDHGGARRGTDVRVFYPPDRQSQL